MNSALTLLDFAVLIVGGTLFVSALIACVLGVFMLWDLLTGRRG